MSVQIIIDKLNELTNIHQQLLEVSKEKTVIVKEGDVDKLQSVLVKERKLVHLVEKAEEARQKAVESWYSTNDIELEEVTVTNLLNLLDDEKEKQALEESVVHLTETIADLKRQEQLNMALIQQSLQFVQLSIDLLSPSLRTMNYGEKGSVPVNRSLFDSKA